MVLNASLFVNRFSHYSPHILAIMLFLGGMKLGNWIWCLWSPQCCWKIWKIWMTMSNKGGSFDWSEPKGSHFINLKSLITLACVVVKPHSFIVVLFTYRDLMLTCWKIAFFFACAYYFLNVETPFFVALVSLLVQVEEPFEESHGYRYAWKCYEDLNNHLRHGSLLGHGPWTDTDTHQSGMKTWTTTCDTVLRLAMALNGYRYAWNWYEDFEEPLATRFVPWPWALNGYRYPWKWDEDFKEPLATRFAAWVRVLNGYRYVWRWYEDLKNHWWYGSPLGHRPWTDTDTHEGGMKTLKNHLRPGPLLGHGPYTDTDTLESGMKTLKNHLGQGSPLGHGPWTDTDTHESGMKTWRTTCDTVRRLTMSLERIAIRMKVLWRLEEPLATQFAAWPWASNRYRYV